MQKKRTKDLFVDSSYQRSGLLKTLLQRFRSEREAGETGENTTGRNDPASPPPGEFRTRADSENPHIKRAASL